MGLLRRLTGRGDDGIDVVRGWTDTTADWRDAEFAVVDLETTGLDLRRDEIVSYGGVVVRSGRLVVSTAVYGLVRPTRAVSPESVEVHALRPEDLAAAPPPEACAAALAELLTGRVLVAHAAWVEQAFVGRLLQATGRRFDGPVVDTAALARESLVVRERGEGEPGLEDLAGTLGLPAHTPHHALGDALTTATVLLALLARLEAREPQSVRSLSDATRRRSVHRVMG
jgi:DNA polymerase-3 subunit epsilon